MHVRGYPGGYRPDRQARQPRCAANAPITAVAHHTVTAAMASGAENSPIAAPAAV